MGPDGIGNGSPDSGGGRGLRGEGGEGREGRAARPGGGPTVGKGLGVERGCANSRNNPPR